MTPDYVIIGHISLDSAESDARIGGTAAYSARAAKLLGRRVGVVTAVPVDPSTIDELRGIECLSIPSQDWTRFENHYETGKRQQKWISTAAEIEVDDVPISWQLAQIVHVGPIAQEISPQFVMGCPTELNCATLQGWLRARSTDSKVLLELNAELETGLKYLDGAVLSEEDVISDPVLIEQLTQSCRLLVLTRGGEGCDVYVKGERQRVTTTQIDVEDPTGAGDVFAAAFFVRFAATQNPVESAKFANRFSAWILEKPERLDLEPEQFERDFPESD
jgi:sugar/nucleoside kinase (ribokinase family)